MNVLSLFDGISCGQVALQRSRIIYNSYYASEIDAKAVAVTQKNFPKTVQLGDVRSISGKNLPEIDLLFAGSPCQGFSVSGKRLGLEDPRSKLFYEFVRILEEVKPKWFLLENVPGAEDVITETLGIRPVSINSAIVSAQDRRRLYWTNLKFTAPEDKGLYLRDIMLDLPGDRPCRANKGTGRHVAIAEDINGHDVLKRVYSPDQKAPTLNAMTGGNREPKVLCANGLYRKLLPIECERLQTIPDNYTDCVSKSHRYKGVGNGWTVDVIRCFFT